MIGWSRSTILFFVFLIMVNGPGRYGEGGDRQTVFAHCGLMRHERLVLGHHIHVFEKVGQNPQVVRGLDGVLFDPGTDVPERRISWLYTVLVGMVPYCLILREDEKCSTPEYKPGCSSSSMMGRISIIPNVLSISIK